MNRSAVRLSCMPFTHLTRSRILPTQKRGSAASVHQLLIIGLLLALVVLSTHAAAATIDISNFSGNTRAYIHGAATDLTDYQVKFVLYNITGTDSSENIHLPGIVQPTFNDVRFALSDGTEMSYWRETPTGTNNATFWVKVPSIPAGYSNTVAVDIYYGNTTTESAANGDATFALFDDFNESSLNTTKWTVASGTDYSVSNSQLVLKGTTTIQTNTDFSKGESLRFYGNLKGYQQNFGFMNSSNLNDYAYANVNLGSGAEKLVIYVNSVSQTSGTSGYYWSANEYRTGELFWNSTYIAFTDGVNPVSAKAAVLTATLPAYLSSKSGTSRTGYYDWVFVRQLADSEPTVNEPGSTTGTTDLTITGITPLIFAHYTQSPISTTISNLGTADAGAFHVTFNVDGNTTTVAVAGLGAGNSTVVSTTDTVDRTGGASVPILVTADSGNEISETNETNNQYSTTTTTIVNGYTGHRWSDGPDLTTNRTYDIHGDIIYSFGDSTYGSDTSTWTAGNLPIPNGAIVKDARLYVPYCWDSWGHMLGTTTMTFNGVVVPYEEHYREQKNWGDWSTYAYGLFIFNVTDLFNTAGNNASFSHEYAPLRGMNLVVTYEDANATEKQIFINENFDMLFASSEYYTTPETSTAYAPFTGPAINMSRVKSASVITSVSRGSARGTMLFNGTSWTSYWAPGQGEIGINTTDITSYLTADNNTVMMRSEYEGLGIEAYLAILKVEYKSEASASPVAGFTASPTTGAYPLTVKFTDTSTGVPSSWLWDFGDGDSTNATVQNPVHTYASAGTYAVNLTAGNSYGNDSTSRTDYISVTSSEKVPVANFTADVFSGLTPLAVQFTDTTTHSPTAWTWEYRASGTNDTWTSFASTQNPGHSFAAGAYDIRLTATNGDGSNTVTKTQYISSSAGPKRLETVQSGTVSGDLYVGAYQSWSTQKEHEINTFTQSFALPTYTNIQWARLYTVVMASNTDNRTGTATVKFDGNGDGTYETTLGTETLSTAGSSAADVYPVNDHVNRQYSDYMLWYNVTNLISSQNPTAQVVSTPVTLTFDGRIKELVLVVAYNDGDGDQVKYWVNDGHDYQAKSAGGITTTFATSSLSSGWTNATLRNVMLSSADALYSFNSNSYTGANSTIYFGTNSWNVSSSLTAGSDSSLTYIPNGGSYKTTLATLAVKYPATSGRPIPSFTANVTSGRVPLTVGFSDTTTGSPTAWSWSFGDGETSTEQNPGHTYLTSGTHSVSLTATGPGGVNSTTVTNAITVGDPLTSNSYNGGIPLTTVQNGTVTGGVWYDAYPGFDHLNAKKTFTLPTHTAVKWARLYVDVYNGHMQNNNRGSATIQIDANGDNTYEIQKSETFNTGYSFPGDGGTGPVWVNDHMNRVTSDYLMWYDLTSAMSGNTVNVNVSTVSIDSSFDNRIKAIILIVAYDNGSNQTVKYWINQGHDTVNPGDTTYIGTTSFATSTLESGWISANLTSIYLASNDGSYSFRGTTLSSGTPTGSYFGTDMWDISSLLTPTQNSSLVYDKSGSSYFKIPLALMTVQYAGNATYNPPVAAFSAEQTSTPFTVQFTDRSTNSPTNWTWNFGDGNTSAETNPLHTFPALGNYTVNLTVSNPAGTSSTKQQVTVSETVSGADLYVSRLAPNGNANAYFALEANNITATIKNTGTTAAGPFVVKVGIDDNSTQADVTGLAAGATTTLVITDPVIRAYGNPVMINVTADPENVLNETTRTNNYYNLSTSVINNGYKGKRYTGGNDSTTHASYDINGNLVYSSGNSEYLSGSFGENGWTQDTATWTATDLPVPANATILEARLYVPYTWDNSNQVPDHIGLSFNGGTVHYQDWYTDKSNFGTYPNHAWGLLTYDVKGDFKKNAQNTATFTRDVSNAAISPYGFTLAVVYEDSSSTRKQIFLNEEFDLLGADSTNYATTPEEATAYVRFIGPDITTADITRADLITFVPSGNDHEGDLLFNGATIASNVWEYTTNTQVAVDTRDVKNYLNPTANVAGIRSTAGSSTPSLAAAHEFLVVRYGPVAAFTQDTVSGDSPLTVRFTDQSLGTPTSWSWDFGDGSSSTRQNPSHTYTTAGTYTVKLTASDPAKGSDTVTKIELITVNARAVYGKSFDLPGVSTGTDGGSQTVSIDAANATVNNSTVNVTGASGSGWDHFDIEMQTAPIKGGGTINGTVAGVTAATEPMTVPLSGVGTPKVQAVLSLEKLPGTTAAINATITENPDATSHSAFSLAASNDGKTINDIAYTVTFTKSGLDNAYNGGVIQNATIYMAVSPGWLTAHGWTTDTMKIMRYAENGTTTFLRTEYLGYDGDGNCLFSGYSPDGLSVFVLASLSASNNNSGGSSGGGGGGSTIGSSVGVTEKESLIYDFLLAPPQSFAWVETTTVSDSGTVTLTPLSADIPGMEELKATWQAEIPQKPDGGGKITTAIVRNLSAGTIDAYQSMLAKTGYGLKNISYSMQVTKDNIPVTKNATIEMTVPQDWVYSNGGLSQMKILRMDDAGNVQILDTAFCRYDRDSRYISFQASSPDGLCTFTLVAVTGSGTISPALTTMMPAAAATTIAPSSDAVSSLASGIGATVAGTYLWIVIAVIVIAACAGLVLFMKKRKGNNRW